MAQNAVCIVCDVGSDMTCVRKVMDTLSAIRLRNMWSLMSV